MNKSIYLSSDISSVKRLLLSTLLLCIYCLNANAQCPSGDIIFNSQQELNDFAVNYPNCTQINSNVIIGTANTPSDINDLSPLNQITIIIPDLIIENNPLLTNLSGLDNLFFIGNTFRIKNNSILTDINALSNIVAIKSLEITDNSALSTLTGLESVIELSVLNIINNPLLTNLGNFAVESLNALNITNNASLTDLSGLESLRFIRGDMSIIDNDALSNINGLQNISNIGTVLRIINNQNLTNVSALENLSAVQQIDINKNNILNDILGLRNIDYNELITLKINNNPELSICHIESICNYLLNGKVSEIQNNDSGCSSVESVEASCIALPVELTGFEAQAQSRSILLAWQTASETNNQGFEIQRSTDGMNWQKIGWQQGVGTSTTRQNYRHNDTQPLSGINYYRLKQVDIEGHIVYSDIVNVAYKSIGFSVFPIPSKKEITLQLESNKATIEIHITNIIGKFIHSQNLHTSAGVNHFTFNISDYPKGIYFLSISNGDKNGTQRFVKH